ncbi:MAG: hypothetical protein ACTS5G_00475, partial [Burkholderiales bacterium]
MSTKKDLFQLAKCLDEEHRLTKRIQLLREKRLKSAKWGWSEWRDNALIVAGSLAEVLAIDPEVKPTWHTYPCDDGSVKGYFVYGPVHLGEVRKG